MKAISLWQPWASAIALGSKRIETRSWSTSYRGPLAIHAAIRWTRPQRILLDLPEWIGALWDITAGPRWHTSGDRGLPFGSIVAVCDLVDCIPTESVQRLRDLRIPEPGQEEYSWTERDMGNFSPGRFAWLLENIRPLKSPLPWKGRQGPFNVEDARIQEALG